MREQHFLERRQAAALQSPQIILPIHWKEGVSKTIRIRHEITEPASVVTMNLRLVYWQGRAAQLAGVTEAKRFEP